MIFDGQGAPYYYDYQNVCSSGVSPSTVHSQNTISVAYYRRYLLQKAIAVFKWDLPKTWQKNYFLYCLYMWGRVAVIETDAYGVIPQGCGLAGYGVQYEPTHAVISNPLLRGLLRPRIGVECSVIRLMPDWGGLMDIVNDYAELMALISEGVSFNVINTKLAVMFSAQNKAAAESLKKAYDQIQAGNPAVVLDKALLDDRGNVTMQMFNAEIGKNFVAPGLYDLLRKVECMFLDRVGIPANLATAKKERTINAEVEANDTETYTGAALWLEQCKAGCDEANRMFGLKLSVDWRVDPLERRSDNEIVNAGTV